MQINLGGFGNAVAQPKRDAYLPAGTGQEVSNALGNIAQAGQQLATTLQAVDEQKQRVQAASQLATLNNDLYDIHDAVGRSVNDGTVKPENAVSEFNTRSAEARKLRTEGMTPLQLEALDPHLVKTTGTLTRNLQGVAIKRTEADIGANILTAGESLQRSALRDLPASIAQYDGIVDTMGAKAGWDPVQITKAKQTFKEGATYNFANATLEGAVQTGDIAMVKAAREKIQGPDGDVIDPAKRTALITKAYGYENGIIASGVREAEKLQREQEARETKGRDAFQDAQQLMLNGRYLSTEYIGRLADVTAGTSAAPAVQELVKAQGEVAGFASMPISRQTAIIEQRRQSGSTASVGTSPEAEKLTDYMQKVTDGTRKAYAENAWTAAQERGVIPTAPAVSLNNIQDAQGILSERMKQINTVEAAAERKVSPLQPQEAEQVGKIIRSLPPDQQSGALAGFGSVIGNSDRVAALAKQIDAKDKVLATAIMYSNSQTTQGRFVSELVLRGERAIKDGTVKVDGLKESGWRASIAKEIGDAFPNQEVRDRMIDAAYYIKAGLTSDGTVKDDITNAVKLATGGIAEQRDGSRVPIPYGMTNDQFATRIKGIQAVDLATQTPDGQVFVGKTAMPVDQFIKQLPDASLVHAGQGRYNVRAGTGLVTNSAGKRITVDVNGTMSAPAIAQPEGLLVRGNIDLAKRPVVKNADGSISTVRSMSVNFDGQEVLIPTVSESGKIMSDDQAIAQYQKTGKHLGIFKTPAQATSYAQKLHSQQEKMYAR